MKKVQLYHQEQQAYVNRAMLQMRQLLNADVEKLLNKHRNELDLKVEDAIARAQTPAPMSAEDEGLREQLRRMVQRGQYNEAFTKALMASDLPVVIDLLEMVDQSKIFLAAGGSTLEQNIILSLIQQLSVDLKPKAELKFMFLRDALMALDNRAPSASHIPRTLAQLQHKIQDYLSNNQRDPMARNFSMLLLTAQGVISQSQATSEQSFAFN